MRLRFPVACAAAAITLGSTAIATMPAASAMPVTAPLAPTAAPASPGGYHQLPPQRVLDTRVGNGVPIARVGAGGTISFPVLGRAGVPSAPIGAVVINLTVVSPTAGTYITAYPSGTAQPTVSSLNVPPGMTRANLVTVPVGTDGRVTLFNASGSVDLLADVAGYYDTNGSGGGLMPLEESRIFDSRSPDFGGPMALGPGEGIDIPVSFEGDTNAHITAFAVNVTAVDTNAPGYFTAWSGAEAAPNASTVNFNAGDTVPNLAIVPVRQEWYDGAYVPTITIQNFAGGDVDLAVDLVAFYGDGSFPTDLRYQATPLTRVLDTRNGIGGAARLGANETKEAHVPSGLVDAKTYGIVSNLTAASPSSATYLTFWYAGEPQPGTSNINAGAGQTVANAAYIDKDYKVFNAFGATDVIVDVSGTFELNSSAPPAAVAARATNGGAGAGLSRVHAPQAWTHTWVRHGGS